MEHFKEQGDNQQQQPDSSNTHGDESKQIPTGNPQTEPLSDDEQADLDIEEIRKLLLAEPMDGDKISSIIQRQAEILSAKDGHTSSDLSENEWDKMPEVAQNTNKNFDPTQFPGQDIEKDPAKSEDSASDNSQIQETQKHQQNTRADVEMEDHDHSSRSEDEPEYRDEVEHFKNFSTPNQIDNFFQLPAMFKELAKEDRDDVVLAKLKLIAGTNFQKPGFLRKTKYSGHFPRRPTQSDVTPPYPKRYRDRTRDN